MIKALRTPEERFQQLDGFPYRPNYTDTLPGFDKLRLHYLDEGGNDSGHTFLCLHGQPTWCYLYRKMIPVFVAAGHRVIAPDFFGFGRSDKPVDKSVYTFDFHRNTLIALIRSLDLDRITLVCQDWGGIIGLTVPMEMANRFSRLLIMNTTLATGDGELTRGFRVWRSWVRRNPDFSPGAILKQTCPHISEIESAAYDVPYPSSDYKAGIQQFPDLFPDQPDSAGAKISRDARAWFAENWSGKTFLAAGMQDTVLGPSLMYSLQKNIRNCPNPTEYDAVGHFVQEWGEQVARDALLAFSN